MQIKVKNKKIFFPEQESVLNNATILLEKRNDLIAQLTKENMISIDKNIFDAPEKLYKITSKVSKQ